MRKKIKCSRLTLLYVLFGSLWIFFSDWLITRSFPHPGFEYVQSIKGFIYIVFTGFLLYILLSRNDKEHEKMLAALRDNSDEIKLLMDNTEENFVMVNTRLEIISYNKHFYDTYLRCFGIQVKKGNSILDYAFPEKKELVREHYSNALQGIQVQDEIQFEMKGVIKTFKNLYKPAYGINYDVIGVFVSSIDITSEREAHKKIIANEERFRALIENVADMISLTDEKGNIIYASPAFEKLTGFTCEELMGTSAYDIMHPDYVTPSKLILAELLANPNVMLPRINKFRHRDGHYIWVEGVSLNLLHNPSVGAIVANYRDITDKKMAGQKMEFDHNNLQALINNTEDLIWSVDLAGNLITCNRAFEKRLKINAGDRDPAPYTKFFEKGLQQNWNGYLDRVSQGESFQVSARAVFGLQDWSEISFYPIRQDEIVVGTACQLRNITERKLFETKLEQNTRDLIEIKNELQKNEKRLLAAQEMAHMGSWETDLATQSITWSQGASRIFGISKAEFETSHPVLKFIHHEDYEDVKKTVENGERDHKKYSFNCRVIRNDGSVRYVDVQCRFISDNISQPQKLQSTIRDITEIRLIEEKLSISEAKLKQAQAVAHVGSWDINSSTSSCTWSDEAFRIYGIDPDKCITEELWLSYIHPHDVKEFREFLKITRESKKPGSLTHRILKSNGEERIVDLEARCETDRSGAVTGLYGVVHDITEKVHAEEELLESHRLLQKLTEKVPVAIYQFDMDNDGKMSFPFMSRGIHRILENVNIENLKNDVSEVFNTVHPDDVPKVYESILQSRVALSEWNLEFRAIGKNGDLIWFYGSGRPELTKQGNVTWYGYLQDVTEKKLANEKIKIAMERYDIVSRATNEAIWDWDIATGTIQLSEGFNKLFGHNLKGVVPFEACLEFLHPAESQEVQRSFFNVVESTSDVKWEYEFRYRRFDGSYANVLDRAYVIRDTNGKALRVIGAMQDISDRKLADKNIHEAKERYDFIAKATNDVLYDWNLETNYVTRTGEGLKVLFGYDQELAIKEKDFWIKRVHPEDFEFSYARLNAILNDSSLSVCSQEYRFRRADGSYAFVFDKGFIIRNDQGKAIRMLGATQDISHLKLAELKIKASNERYNLVLKATRDGIWDYDFTRNIVFIAGNGVKELFGYNMSNSFVKSKFWKLRLHPEDKKDILTKLENFINDQSQTQFSYEYRFQRADGTYAHVNDRLIILRNEGKPLRLIGAMHDITQQKKEEERLRLLESVITNTNEAVMVTESLPLEESGPRIIYVNDAFSNMTGFSHQEVIGSTPRILQGPRTDRDALKAIREALLVPEPVSVELVNYKKNGEAFWVNMDIDPVTDKNGKTTHFIAIQKDITSRKVQEQEREKLIFELIQNNKDLKQFSYITSHNLRGPVANLLGLTNLLEHYPIENATLKQILSGIKKAAGRFDETIRDLTSVLDIRDRPSIPREEIPLSSIHEKALLQCETIINDEQVVINADFGGAPVIRFNKAYLESIFINLLTNAIKYRSPHRKLKIDIKTEICQDETVLSFQDNGRGIDLDLYKEKVFSLYQRFHDDTEGKGLGLFLVKSQLEALNGLIDVKSKVDEGTLFILKFKN